MKKFHNKTYRYPRLNRLNNNVDEYFSKLIGGDVIEIEEFLNSNNNINMIKNYSYYFSFFI